MDLAMMSAGESDIETDRVSCLHTTALGFAPFIFDLEKDAGLNELIDICDKVSEEIKENESLPEKLVKFFVNLKTITFNHTFFISFNFTYWPTQY